MKWWKDRTQRSRDANLRRIVDEKRQAWTDGEIDYTAYLVWQTYGSAWSGYRHAVCDVDGEWQAQCVLDRVHPTNRYFREGFLAGASFMGWSLRPSAADAIRGQE